MVSAVDCIRYAFEHDSIGLLLGRFKLSSLQSPLEEVEAAAGSGSWTYRQFLRELLERGEAMCSGRRLKRLLKDSQLPETKPNSVKEVSAKQHIMFWLLVWIAWAW